MALRPTPTSRAHPSSSLAKASLLASLLLLSGIPGSPAAARDLAVDDLLAMEGIGAVTFSPDGSWSKARPCPARHSPNLPTSRPGSPRFPRVDASLQ